jgi:phosphatidate cytidylyltransferase
MLKTRVITAVVLLAVIIPALVWLPPRGWGGLMLVMLFAAGWEWGRLCGFSDRLATLPAGIVTAAAAVTLMLQPAPVAGDVCLIAAAAVWLVVVPAWLRWRERVPNGVALAALGCLLLLAAWYALWRARDPGPAYLLLLMATVWVADIAAYCAGKAFGRHKLAPAISPGKTWEGVAGAIVGVQIFAIACIAAQASVPNYFGGLSQQAGVGGALLAALLLTGVSVIGDLFESLLKRRAGRKDSSGLLPGHGGVLDRVDAVISTMPVALAIIALVRKAAA